MTEYRRNLDAGHYKPKAKKAKTAKAEPQTTDKDAKPAEPTSTA